MCWRLNTPVGLQRGLTTNHSQVDQWSKGPLGSDNDDTEPRRRAEMRNMG